MGDAKQPPKGTAKGNKKKRYSKFLATPEEVDGIIRSMEQILSCGEHHEPGNTERTALLPPKPVGP